MNPNYVLIVDDDSSTIQLASHVLQDADIRFSVVATDAEAWYRLRTEPAVSLVLVRYHATGIDGRGLCRKIRQAKAPSQLAVLMLLTEDQKESCNLALDAGANDVLVTPCEPRELRMRANIVPARIVPANSSRRIDSPHSDTAGNDSTSGPDIARKQTTIVVPQFDSATMRLTHNISPQQRRRWDADAAVGKIPLDTVMLCPECYGVPTFRLGCRHCGCGLTESAEMIHHFACAHIGPEAEFRRGKDMTCPKCRLSGLVAGSDFEIVDGGLICSDCRIPVTQPELIGHCLNCDHRFAAGDAVVDELVGYRIPHMRRVRRGDQRPAAVQKQTARPVVRTS